ncbi:saccharopine dehydrogenase [Streptomyces viridochromogenes]|uniref:Saccharopine dehydrogenase [NAD(+), L-lysine-forming] n=2 Tax=Streptomyces TaxID=1883 RepID=A0A0L8JFM9_STRVR|nr:saccharopine dehydrogenase [Streptomyces viridochromogenes]
MSELRAPLAPEHAGELVRLGVRLVVEESADRTFPIEAYAAAGCAVAPAGSWPDAPVDAYVLGLKELPPRPYALVHRHVFFGHAYKSQPGGSELLRRFTAGGGTLLDLEYAVDAAGRRIAAFGYWAGYVGANVAALHAYGRLGRPLVPGGRDAWDAALVALGDTGRSAHERTSALVIGAAGRCGAGACEALERAGIRATRWGHDETQRLDRKALLAHDLLVNTIGTATPVAPFVTKADLDDPGRRLRLLCDVTCDVGSPCNAVPVYDRPTTWAEPVVRVHEGDPPLDVIALDNLPSLLPTESSRAFSADLWPHLLTLRPDGPTGPAWVRSLDAFRRSLLRVPGSDSVGT